MSLVPFFFLSSSASLVLFCIIHGQWVILLLTMVVVYLAFALWVICWPDLSPWKSHFLWELCVADPLSWFFSTAIFLLGSILLPICPFFLSQFGNDKCLLLYEWFWLVSLLMNRSTLGLLIGSGILWCRESIVHIWLAG